MKFLTLFLFTYTFCLQLSAETLRVVTEDLPPYQVVINDELVGGSSFLLVQEMLLRANIMTPIELLPWARAYKIASSSPNVIIFSIARNKERETNFHWLFKLRALTYHFYSLAARPDLKALNLSALLRQTVVTVRHSYEANSLLKTGFVEGKNLILTSTYKEAWQMLLMGRADYTYANELVQDTIFEPLNISPNLFSQSFDLSDTSDLYIAASIGTSPSLLENLQHSLATMQQDGTVKKILSSKNKNL